MSALRVVILSAASLPERCTAEEPGLNKSPRAEATNEACSLYPVPRTPCVAGGDTQ